MNGAIFSIFLAISASGFEKNWVFVGSDYQGNEISVDEKSIKSSGRFRYVWMNERNSSESNIIYYKLDCEYMGIGVVYIDRSPYYNGSYKKYLKSGNLDRVKVIPIEGGSVNELVSKIICK